MSCGHTLSWYELFPLFSYLVLRGRCKECGARIPVRLFLMEITTGILYAYTAVHAGSLLELFFGLVVMSLLIVVAAYDIRHMVIPHEFVLSLGVVALIAVAIEMSLGFGVGLVLEHLVAALSVSAFFGFLWLISKGRWIGLGDAKLAFPLAFMLTPLEGFSMVVLSFWVGAAVSVLLLLVQRILVSGQRHLSILRVPLTMKSEVPFAPFLIAAFILVYFQGIEVLSLLWGIF